MLALLRGPVTEAKVQTTDEEVVSLIQKGSSNEFRVLIERHQNGIFSLVMRQVGVNHIAEELTHEIFIKAFTGLKGFRGQSRFSSWLIRIAINHTHTFFRSKRYKQMRQSESFTLEKHDYSSQDENGAVQQERALEKFREALATLKPKFRDVLVLCGLEGRSYEEVSEILKIPVGTVRSRLHTARMQIKNSLLGEI